MAQRVGKGWNMGQKRAATAPPAIPLETHAPSGVLGVLDDLSSMILGELATRRKLQAILETLSEHLEVDDASIVLGCRLGRERHAPSVGDPRLAALRDYPGLLSTVAGGEGTLVANGSRAGSDSRGAAFSVPICRGGGIIGLLCISTPPDRVGLSPWEVDFCSILANMAGAVLSAE